MKEKQHAAPTESLLNKDKNPSNIVPQKFTLDSTITFRCHPGVSCFTECCGNINIILTPYDILRLRKRLQLDAVSFLHTYAEPTFLEKSDMPGVRIRLNDEQRCPFVREDGCTVYSDRPTACRYYPVGAASFHQGGQDNQAEEAFYFLIKESHCKGFQEDTTWTIRDWRKDQEVDLYDEMNKRWLELIMRRKSFTTQATLGESAKRMFFMASTDLDHFRSFVFESSFLEKYEVDPTTLEEIRNDDIALLQFALKYLESALFGTEVLHMKQDVLKQKVAEISRQGEKSKENFEARAEAELNALKEERKKAKES